MNDIEKINEELRNYKLFKIQRLNTREKEFTDFNKDLVKIKQFEILNLFIGFLNIVSISCLVYNIYTSRTIAGSIVVTNKLIFCIAASILLSIYLTYRFVNTNHKLKKHIKTTEKAINYFSNESDNLKSNYESYVDNFLEGLKRNK